MQVCPLSTLLEGEGLILDHIEHEERRYLMLLELLTNIIWVSRGDCA